jgi:hypothetical protein
MRTIFVGISPGNSSKEPLSLHGMSGKRLSRLLRLPSEEYLARFDRVNLLPFDGISCYDEVVADLVENLRPLLRGRRVVALGSKVQRALNLPDKWFDWSYEPGFVGASIPHPSGKNRWWNDPGQCQQAGVFLEKLNSPCIHVEGADGSGKSHLVKQLVECGGMYVPTENPPTSWGDCLLRVRQRISSGAVCDRSSGLVSELVYGPVLRGRTIESERKIWELLQKVIHAVTFIYCRPSKFRLTSRPDESPEHVKAVEDNHEALVRRYDEVFDKMSCMGAKVIQYDWTSQSFDRLKSYLNLP